MPAEVHHADLVADVAHDREVVRDEEVGQAVARLQVLHDVEDLRLHRDVERRGRLVADQELGLRSRARARSRCAAAGRPRTGAGTSRRRQPPGRPTPAARRRDRRCAAVRPSRQRRRRRRSRARAAARRRCRCTFQRGLRLAYGSWKIICMRRRIDAGRGAAGGAGVDAVEHDPAARRRVEADQQARHRALAAARFADQRQRLAARDREADVVDRVDELARLALDDAVEPGRRDVEGLGQALDLDQRVALTPRRPQLAARAASTRPASRRPPSGRGARRSSGRTPAGSAG